MFMHFYLFYSHTENMLLFQCVSLKVDFFVSKKDTKSLKLSNKYPKKIHRFVKKIHLVF